MAQQLPLPIRLRAASVFATYCVGDNQQAVQTLMQLNALTASPIVVLHGPGGVGKSHLLQAVCAAAGPRGEAASYVPLHELQHYGPEIISGTSALTILCIDDVQLIAADRDWNQALFGLHREADERGAKIVLACNTPPAALPWALPDWSSRLLAGAILRLTHLDDASQRQALWLHASQRGFELPDDVARYLLRRLPRDMGKLCQLIDDLDVALLAAQRRLTIAFVRQWLQDTANSVDAAGHP